MTYLDRLIKSTKASIPGYFKPEIFNHSTMTFKINGPQSGTDSRGNPIYAVTELLVKAVLYKKPRINKVIQRIDRLSSFDVYEGNVIEPLEFPSIFQQEISKSEGEIVGDAVINGVAGKVRLVSIGRGYLEPYNRLIGRVIQVEFIGDKVNV
jgi:hypothetical protein